MILAMKAKTERDAFTEALTYYQNRTQEVEAEYKSLVKTVGGFVESLKEQDSETDNFDLNTEDWQ